jgi:hypothetical protein
VSGSLQYASNGRRLLTAPHRVESSDAVGIRTLDLPGGPLGDVPSTLWVSMIGQQLSGSASDTFLGLNLLATGPDPYLYFGKPYQAANWGISGTDFISGIPATTKALLVMRVDFKPGDDDVHFWVNPPLGVEPSLASADIAAPALGDFTGITQVRMDTGNGGAGGVITGTLDEIRFGPTYASVTPSEPLTPGDLDADGDVDGADLGIYLGAWGASGGPADLDGNGIVNGADLGILLANWGP